MHGESNQGSHFHLDNAARSGRGGTLTQNSQVPLDRILRILHDVQRLRRRIIESSGDPLAIRRVQGKDLASEVRPVVSFTPELSIAPPHWVYPFDN